MAYWTPNIDGVPNEGEGVSWPTFTASRAAPPDIQRFITGQNPLRTGLTKKVGVPGASVDFKRKTQPSPNFSSHSAMPPASSAKTISAIGRIPADHAWIR
jgi:hypothetical protein